MVISVVADIIAIVDHPLNNLPVILFFVAEKLIVQEERGSDIVIRVLSLYLFEDVNCATGFKLRRTVIVPAFQNNVIDTVIESKDQGTVSECDIDISVNKISKPHHAVALLVKASQILFESFGSPVISVLVNIAAGILRLAVFHIVDPVVHKDRHGIEFIDTCALIF